MGIHSNIIITVTDSYGDSTSLGAFSINVSPKDTDNDGVDNFEDNCPADANPDQTDLDNDGAGDAHIFMPDTGVTWDSTVTNTNTRYYNVGGYESAGSLVYGDHQIALQIMAQEIAV